MVPHSLDIAKRKVIQMYNVAEILVKDWQFLGKLVQISRISHRPLNASQKNRLPAMARLCGCQRQQLCCFNTNTYPRRSARRPQYQRCLSCAISKCAYKNVCSTFERTSYSAAGVFNPDGDHARNRGSSKSDQQSQEPRLSPISLADIRSSALKANNRPCQTVVSRHTHPQRHLCELGTR